MESGRKRRSQALGLAALALAIVGLALVFLAIATPSPAGVGTTVPPTATDRPATVPVARVVTGTPTGCAPTATRRPLQVLPPYRSPTPGTPAGRSTKAGA